MEGKKRQPPYGLPQTVAISLLLLAAGLGLLKLPTVVLAVLAWGLSGRRVPPGEIS